MTILIRLFRYGPVPSETRGSTRTVIDTKIMELFLQSGERIKSMSVYMSMQSKYVCGVQFKTTSRESKVFGQVTKFLHPVRSPYANGFFARHLCGKRL